MGLPGFWRWLPTALLLGILAALAVLTRGFTAFPSTYYMTGPSMAPTVGVGDWFLARPLIGAPERGELVVMRYVEGDSTWHVLRRVVALAGDTVSMRAGLLWVNGRAPNWPARILVPDAERALDGRIRGTIYTWGPVTVGPDSVFVLSDTRDMVGWPDSRWLGAIPTSAVADRYLLRLRRGDAATTPAP